MECNFFDIVYTTHLAWTTTNFINYEKRTIEGFPPIEVTLGDSFFVRETHNMALYGTFCPETLGLFSCEEMHVCGFFSATCSNNMSHTSPNGLIGVHSPYKSFCTLGVDLL